MSRQKSKLPPIVRQSRIIDDQRTEIETLTHSLKMMIEKSIFLEAHLNEVKSTCSCKDELVYDEEVEPLLKHDDSSCFNNGGDDKLDIQLCDKTVDTSDLENTDPTIQELQHRLMTLTNLIEEIKDEYQFKENQLLAQLENSQNVVNMQHNLILKIKDIIIPKNEHEIKDDSIISIIERCTRIVDMTDPFSPKNGEMLIQNEMNILYEKHILFLEKNVNTQQKEISFQQDIISEMEEIELTHYQRIKVLEQQLKQLSTLNSEISDRLNDHVKDNNLLTSKNKHLGKEYTRILIAKTQLQQLYVSNYNILQKLEENINDLQCQCRHHSEEKKALLIQVKNLQNQLQTESAEKDVLSDEIHSVSTDLQTEAAKRKTFLLEIKNLQDEFEAETAEKISLLNEINGLHIQFKVEKNNLLSQIKTLQDQLRKEAFLNSERINDINMQYLKGHKNLVEKISTLESRYEDQVNLIATNDNEYKNHIAELNCEISCLKHEISVQQEILKQTCELNNETHQQIVNKLNDQIYNLQNELNLKQHLNEVYSRSESEHKSKMVQLKDECDALIINFEKRIDTLHQQLNEQINTTYVTKETYMSQIEVLKNEKQNLEDSIDCLNKKISHLIEDNEALKEVNEDSYVNINFSN
jgi:hypothetical protein